MAQEKFYLAPQRYSFPAKLPLPGVFGPAEVPFSREVGVAGAVWPRRDTLFPRSCRVRGHLVPLRYLFPAKLGMYGGDGGVLCTFAAKLSGV